MLNILVFIFHIESQNLTDGFKVMEIKAQPMDLLRNIGGTVRVTTKKQDPDREDDSSVLKFVSKGNNNYLIKFSDGLYMCAKPRDNGVVACKNETDPHTVWEMAKLGKRKYTFKGRNGRCLVVVNMDNRSATKGNYLNTRNCKSRAATVWKIRNVKFKPEPPKDDQKEQKDKEKKIDDALKDELKNQLSKPKPSGSLLGKDEPKDKQPQPTPDDTDEPPKSDEIPGDEPDDTQDKPGKKQPDRKPEKDKKPNLTKKFGKMLRDAKKKMSPEQEPEDKSDFSDDDDPEKCDEPDSSKNPPYDPNHPDMPAIPLQIPSKPQKQAKTPGDSGQPQEDPNQPEGSSQPQGDPSQPGGSSQPKQDPSQPGGSSQPQQDPSKPGSSDQPQQDPSQPKKGIYKHNPLVNLPKAVRDALLKPNILKNYKNLIGKMKDKIGKGKNAGIPTDNRKTGPVSPDPNANDGKPLQKSQSDTPKRRPMMDRSMTPPMSQLPEEQPPSKQNAPEPSPKPQPENQKPQPAPSTDDQKPSSQPSPEENQPSADTPKQSPRPKSSVNPSKAKPTCKLICITPDEEDSTPKLTIYDFMRRRQNSFTDEQIAQIFG